MKKLKIFIPILLLAVLILTGFSCGEESKRKKDEDEEKDELEDYTLYKNEEWDFEIYYPEDWEKEIVFDEIEGIQAYFTSPEQGPADDFQESVFLMVGEPDPYTDFDEYATDTVAMMEADEATEMIKFSKETISGYPAYKLVYAQSSDWGEYQSLEHFLNTGDTWALISYTAKKDQYSEFLDEVEIMVDSFEIK